MPKHTTTAPSVPARTIGLDLSDRTLRYCEIDAAGTIIATRALLLPRAALCHDWSKLLRLRPKGAPPPWRAARYTK